VDRRESPRGLVDGRSSPNGRVRPLPMGSGEPKRFCPYLVAVYPGDTQTNGKCWEDSMDVNGDRLTRRTLLGGALAAAVAGPALLRGQLTDARGAAAPKSAARPPAGGLSRGVALGPGGVGDEQRYGTNRRYFGETGCAWVRLWAEWPKLQPASDRPPDFSALDAEIAAARADGLNVMVTAWRFPGWANGTAALTPEQDAAFEIADRLAGGNDPAGRKHVSFRLPADLGPAGPFAQWIAALAERDVDALEIVNEPNHQVWPQRGIAPAIARMIATTRGVLDRLGDGAPLLVAPATADRRGTSVLDTDHLEFARDLLDALDEIGFRPGPRTAWSHHNYGDVESDGSDRIAALRELLTGRWAGWPEGDPLAPGLLVTESGARLTVIARNEGLVDPALIRGRQADLIARGYDRLRLGPEGAGVALVMQYLFISDANYDSGLCELDGRPRPAYYAWAQLPTAR
jgi:hypothetical protein